MAPHIVVTDVIEHALPPDWATPEADIKHAIQKSDDVVVVVHAVAWHPICVSTILAARRVARERAAAGIVGATICCADQDGQWAWAKHYDIIIGTPCIMLYHAGKRLKLEGCVEALAESSASSEVPHSHAVPRNDKFVGHASAPMLAAMIDAALDMVARRGGQAAGGVTLPRVDSSYLVQEPPATPPEYVFPLDG